MSQAPPGRCRPVRPRPRLAPRTGRRRLPPTQCSAGQTTASGNPSRHRPGIAGQGNGKTQ
eukprot:9156641-Alexandrium_andersonii.AAC.1